MVLVKQEEEEELSRAFVRHSPIKVIDRAFGFGFDVLHQGLVQLTEVPVSLVDRPFERAVFSRQTVSDEKKHQWRESLRPWTTDQ